MKKRLYRLYQWIINGIPEIVVSPSIAYLSDNQRLAGKKIVIIGGTRGIGFAIAKKCIDCGASVLITGRDESSLVAAAAKLNNCKWLTFDLTDIKSFPSFFHKADELLSGGINCVVNNAALYLHENNFLEVTPDGFDAQFLTNVKGPYFLCQEYIRYLHRNMIDNASVLFISSEFGLYCSDVPYSLGKAAINSLTAGLSRRFIKEGIRVNAIAPGVMTNDIPGIEPNNIYRKGASGNRFIMPDEIGEMASYLLSDSTNCISGYVFPCNQGNHNRCDW